MFCEGDLSLMAVLKQRIAQLLKDKEETVMTAAVANSWLSNEAASFQAINRAGTFRLYFLMNIIVCCFLTSFLFQTFTCFTFKYISKLIVCII